MGTYNDLREWMKLVDDLGELRTIRGAHWDLELGAIADEVFHMDPGPAVVFDDVPGYRSGFRNLVNCMGSFPRVAVTLGLEPTNNGLALLDAWRKKRATMTMTPAEPVATGPVMQNVQRGKEVDLSVFPTPKWHEDDGGRYLGTGCAVLTKHPDTDWINLGCYRVQVQDDQHVAVMTSPGKHGAIHRQLWAEKGEPMPIAVSIGQDPLLMVAAFGGQGWGECEYDFAGAVKGRAIEVIPGPVTGLPIPAAGDIVIEGFMLPEKRPEGPFGEWLGYYASGARPDNVIKIEGVYYQDDPIILGQPPMKPPSGYALANSFLRSADVWEQLLAAGLGGITGVWSHQLPGVVAVSMKPAYGGHAVQVGQVTSNCQAGAYLNRMVIVVDDDIDPSDLGELMWAVCTRADPEKDYHVTTNCWSSALDPLVSPEQRDKRDFTNSRVIIDATRPFSWRNEFPKVNAVSPTMRAEMLQKWGDVIEGLRVSTRSTV
jgi:4-hydroxy-3-polyprenylbenzoate decarboxylase